jgi:hypothetical protein
MTTDKNTNTPPPKASSIPPPPPALSAPALQRLAATELALPPRLGYIVLLLAALMMIGIIGSLWLTEPSLPRRTQAGFAMMLVIGASWVVFALWVLTRRRVLFARQRIVAGRMAVTFTALFTIGAVAVGFATGGAAPYVTAATGLVMLGVALTMLRRAHRTFARLMERRQALEARQPG